MSVTPHMPEGWKSQESPFETEKGTMLRRESTTLFRHDAPLMPVTMRTSKGWKSQESPFETEKGTMLRRESTTLFRHDAMSCRSQSVVSHSSNSLYDVW